MLIFLSKTFKCNIYDVSIFSGEGKDETNERQDNSGIANGKLFSYINRNILQEWTNHIQYLYL